MPLADDINKAINAHGKWKERLRQAIDAGNSEWTVDQVRLDNSCDFGKWLYSLPDSEQTPEHRKKVNTLHAAFHIEAANVLDLALKGQKAECNTAMERGGAFARVSARLIMALTEWRQSLS